MHELSIVMSIIDIAQREASKANAMAIDEIELDIGALSGVEIHALDFAWNQAVKATILEHAVKKINLLSGKAICLDCATGYDLQNYYDPCPTCGGHFIQIEQGKELRVKSLLVS